MIKPGFSMLEFIIGAMISTILITASFTIYNTISKSSVKIESYTIKDTKLMMLYHRLQKDLISINPLWFSKNSSAENKRPATDEQIDKESDTNKKNNGFFYAKKNEQNEFQYFTFITTQGTSTFDEPYSPYVRVVYKLKKDSTTKNFSLMRKEIKIVSADFKEEDLLKDESFYIIINNMLSCKVDFMFIDKPDKNEKDEQNTQITIKNFKDWEALEDNTEKKEKQPLIPKFIKIRIKFANNTEKNEEHEIICKTYIDPYNKLIPFSQKKPQTNPSSQPEEPRISNA